MRRKRDYTDYLRDILDAAQKAEGFMAGGEFEAFQTNEVADMCNKLIHDY